MKKLQHVVGLLIILFFSSNLLWAQTGPGGIGKTDGTSSLKLWLDGADASTKTLNSTAVSQWSDKSGVGNHATQSTSSKQPANNSIGINSRQTITFDGSDDNFVLPSNSVLSNNAPCSFFCLVKPTTLSGYKTVFCAGVGGGYTAFETNGTKFNFYDAADGIHTTDGATTLSTGTTYILDVHISSGTGTAILNMNLNGVNDFTSSATTFGTAIGGGNSDRTIGGTASGAQFWSGEIGEVIMYNTKLNSAEKIIVGSFLGTKWGTTYSGSKYGGSSTFGDNVIGIGKESDGSNTSAKAGGLTLIDNSSLNANGEYLLAGHTTGTNSVVTNDVGSSGATHRWNRIWYLDKTGTLDGANAQIGFDFSDAGMSGNPVTAANYRLLFRSGTTGDFSTVTTATSLISGDNMNFTVTDANLVDGYYTIGTTDNTNSPLPVELTSFTAHAKGANVELIWKTATEVNNYGFEVERRDADGLHIHLGWTKAGLVEGSGTTNAPKEYLFQDKNINTGKYSYRLKQIDRDGKFEYSKEIEVSIVGGPLVFDLMQNYPNPFNPTTVISYQIPMIGHISLKVFDALGREAATLVDETKEAGVYSITFDAAKLSSGIYFVKLQSVGSTQIKKMILMK
ncbi:MAG: T9SS type A sorting domain-containing protein [Bacteroidota bacterium]